MERINRWRAMRREMLCIALGFIINVAVAWGLAVRPRPDDFFRAGFYARSKYDETHPQTFVYKRTGELRLLQQSLATGDDITPFMTEAEYRALLPWNSAFSGREPVLRYRAMADVHEWAITYDERLLGWPLPVLRSHQVKRWARDNNAMLEMSGLPVRKIPPPGESIALPLAPVWPGLALNTLLYAAILWLVSGGPFAVRRFIRARRGCCTRCGYDLRGQVVDLAGPTVCPECGTATKQ